MARHIPDIRAIKDLTFPSVADNYPATARPGTRTSPQSMAIVTGEPNIVANGFSIDGEKLAANLATDDYRHIAWVYKIETGFTNIIGDDDRANLENVLYEYDINAVATIIWTQSATQRTAGRNYTPSIFARIHRAALNISGGVESLEEGRAVDLLHTGPKLQEVVSSAEPWTYYSQMEINTKGVIAINNSTMIDSEKLGFGVGVTFPPNATTAAFRPEVEQIKGWIYARQYNDGIYYRNFRGQ